MAAYVSVIIVAIIVYILLSIWYYLFRKQLYFSWFYSAQNVRGTRFVPLLGDARQMLSFRNQPGDSHITYWRQLSQLATRSKPRKDAAGAAAEKREIGFSCYLGPEFRLVVTDCDSIKEILFSRAKSFHKPPLARAILGELLGEGLVLSEGATHARHRHMINPMFYHASIRPMGVMMTECASRCINDWVARQKDAGGDSIVVEAHKEISRITLDIIARSAFGDDDTGGSSSSSGGVYEALSDLVDAAASAISNLTAFIPGWRYLPIPSNIKTNQRKHEVKTMLQEIIRKRRLYRAQVKKETINSNNETSSTASSIAPEAAAASDPKVEQASLLLDCLLDAREVLDEKASAASGNSNATTPTATTSSNSSSDGVGLTDSELFDQAMTFVLAGHETTSQALSWTLYLLARNLEWRKKAQEQVLAVVGTDRAPTVDDIPAMPLLQSILHESMRLYPPVPFITREVIEKVDVCGTKLAPGTIIVIPIAGIHTSEDYWKDPEVFDPSRWEGGMHNALAHPCSYLPFSHGTRNCIGREFALQEARLILALLLQKLESFELEPSYQHAPQMAITLRPSKGLPMRLKFRA